MRRSPRSRSSPKNSPNATITGPTITASRATPQVYLVKYVTEKIGKFDRKAFGATMKGLTLTPATAPGILMEASWDQNGDIDRASFLAEIIDGKQKIVETLPKLKIERRIDIKQSMIGYRYGPPPAGQACGSASARA